MAGQLGTGVETAGIAGLAARELRRDEWEATVPPDELPDVAEALLAQRGVYFCDMFGVATDGASCLRLLFAVDDRSAWLHLIVPLPTEAPRFPSIVGVCPAALWYERQVAEACGFVPVGHPGPLHLRLPNDWPEGVFPMRAGHRWAEPVRMGTPRRRELEAPPPGIVDYPLGPVRSGVVESGHYVLRTAGEEIVDFQLQLFYKHRGIEKQAEGLPLFHLPLVAERISGTSGFGHSLALCQAVERAAGVEAPLRARHLRTLFAELERLYNHLGYHADLCQATGLVVGQAQFDILKERMLRLHAAIAGHRYLFGLNVPGGLARDLNPEMLRMIDDELVYQREAVGRLEALLFASYSHVDRLEHTGILTPGDARAWGVVGPVGRASGCARDARRDHPYAAYASTDLDVPVETGGDALARARVRLAEIEQSFRIADRVLRSLPPGPVRLDPRSWAVPAGASALGWAETPRGEALHWLWFGDDGTPRRYRVRTPSFATWQAVPLAIPGHNILTDLPVIEQSFGLSFAGADG